MFRRTGVLLLGVAAAAAVVVGSSAGARTQSVAPTRVLDLGTRAGVLQYLRVHHVKIGTRPVVIQRGFENYAGPSCPGIGWACTTSVGKVVVQFAKMDAGNQFQCTPSSAGPQSGPNDCTIVQISNGGDNNATCVEQSIDNGAPPTGLTQNCTIQQVNSAGNNYATIRQFDTAHSGSSQSTTQNAGVYQRTTSGTNNTNVSQGVVQQTQGSGDGSQTQEANQTAAVEQDSDTGGNNANVQQSQVQQEQLAGSTVNQSQNATPGTNGPNLDAAVYQYSSLNPGEGGANNGVISQSLNQTQTASSRNATGSQTQGSSQGGLHGHFEQHSSGLSLANGTQNEHQVQNSTGLATSAFSQTQLDPMWFGSPQTGNPGDRYTIGQNSDQHSSDNAEQVIRIFTNCDSDGTCIGQEDATQNGNHESNSCSGTSCHIETVCGGFETEAGGCFTTSECDGDCGNPPPSPSPPPPPVNVCELEVCIG